MSSTATAGNVWKTAVTSVEPNEVRVRGYDLAELMGRLSFGEAVYLILEGERPSEPVGRLIDAILVSSIDHGVAPPPAMAARTVASTGASLGPAVAAGVLAINQFHGGEIEAAARQLGSIVDRCCASGEDLSCVATAVVDEMKREGHRLSGFGDRVHDDDPRAARLFALAEDAGVAGDHVDAARAVEAVFRAAGKTLPINVNGAIGAILADLELEPSTMNALFVIARVPGLAAHALEERKRERPVRRIDPDAHAYDGPAPRSL